MTKPTRIKLMLAFIILMLLFFRFVVDDSSPVNVMARRIRAEERIQKWHLECLRTGRPEK